MAIAHEYRSEPLRLWGKAKELRLKYYEDYARAHERGGLRWAGGAWTLDALPLGLGEDVWGITSEPYAASIAFNKKFSLRCLEATEKAGFARDLCSYMRNYWGSVILDEYAFPEFSKQYPRPDFIFQDHICCSHAKWYQVVSDLEGGIPMFCVDVATGPAIEADGEGFRYVEMAPHAVNYLVGQCLDAIDWMQQVTGREYHDELLRRAIYDHMRSTSAWARICELQRTVPAPLDETTMYSLYVHGTLAKASRWCADFYEELLEEVQERVTRGIAAVPNEKVRVISDTQPPWGFLKVFRYLEQYGCVSIGSLYTFGLIGQWEIKADGCWGARSCPDGIEAIPAEREAMLAEYVKYEINTPEWQLFYHPRLKSAMMIKMARDWKLDGVMLHYNRGCEGLSVGIAENRLALQKAGFPVMTFEGNMGDEREFDEARVRARFDAFMETLGMKKLSA
ncbi:MAG: benzoyl-CoA reductase, bzd-type, subunit O [Acidobacteriota bacterium]|nr:MAG: benzoyl-CoA reductase, bzd-type, subunit O [Acidobacteriota bacterium]